MRQSKLFARCENTVKRMKMILHPSLDMVLRAAKECHDALEAEDICHVVIGGSAVYLHGGVDRQPRDVDLLIRDADRDKIGLTLGSMGGYSWHDFRKAYCSPHGVRVEPHWDGKKTRSGKLQLPDPVAIKVDDINGLPVIALAQLIETKLQCELQTHGNGASDPKHRKDILTLIHLKNLGESYADKLDLSVRDLFRELARQEKSQTYRK